MINSEMQKRILADEHKGEKLISNVRLVMALIYTVSTSAVAVIKFLEGSGNIPMRSHVWTTIFLLYAVFLFIYVRKKEALDSKFKYICVTLDMIILSATIWVSCTYLEISSPLPFLSSRALFYSILILAGSFRYSTRCAYFSGYFGAVCFLLVVIINRDTLDLPYFFIHNDQILDVRFPLYNELFKFFGIIITGTITGLASKRRLALFNSMIQSESAAAEAAVKTVEQTRNMAKTIRQSTDEIFFSSKDIFSTANNQAASVQEIESTMNENTQIAGEIAEKTGSVANIASKMENDVVNGFSVLKRNVNQMEDIKKKNDGVISGIIALGDKITRIRDIIKTINTITNQTKVIAFNAALEAASAGDKGKRFSVVASEVNRLADDIASLTKQVREQIEEIQDSSSSLIISSEESADKITEGNNLIKDLEDIFREIRSGAEITANQAQTITVSTQKQQKSTEQINLAIADIASGLSNFLQSTQIATASAEGLTQIIEELGVLLNVKIDIAEGG
ncbi:MAG: methyl-accepting chemotaxis protein [Treponema sp.]|jgi:methyl-accepting chemotaxis protein|nr:methyl-accepting chemotaxis protein [Treponema sp.]